MDELVRNLQINEPTITGYDAARIVAVASAPKGESLNDIAEQFFISRAALSYSLGKLFRSASVPGINNRNDLRKWAQGLGAGPFEWSLNIFSDVNGPARNNNHCGLSGRKTPTTASEKYSISDAATMAFLQAFGTTLAAWNEVPLEDRHRESFIEIFDAYLGMILQNPNLGDAVREDVNRLRLFLDVALRQALERA